MWVRAIAHTAVALSIAISGNHFVNGAGQTVRLLGVDREGTEYACQQGWAYSNGDDDAAAAAADAAAIAAWHANAVRVPLNEDCWLGINGQPSYGSQSGYQQMVETYVADLNADGIYAILDLHWSAPDATVADGQRPMADDHSAAFWTSVATAFKSNPAVVFDAFNEPYSPAANYADAANYPLTWGCWENGGCTLPTTVDGTDPGANPDTYQAVGMQALVTAIRDTGATQPILLGGLSYSNDLSQWLAYEPDDPAHQLGASLHSYEGEACADTSCFSSEVAPVAAQVPVTITEFDENPCADASDSFDANLMNWADQNGLGYLAWSWTSGATPDCSDYYLVDQNGNAFAPNGTLLKAHLAALAAASATTTPMTTTPTTTTTPSPVVSKPLRCVVPKLIGDTLKRARTLLRRAHCALGRASYHKPRARLSAKARRRPPVVIKATPARGRKLKAGTKVRLVLQRR
jgi:hypothetical protein